jgi:outer membrane protein assembly factor BamE (lipoprotein component of BamABCDE complex)
VSPARLQADGSGCPDGVLTGRLGAPEATAGRRSSLAAKARMVLAGAYVCFAGALAAGCGFASQNYQRGYILADGALEQIPLGASQEQVLVVLGTPSTVATISGEVFYYISQRTQQTSFLPQEEINRRIVAIYFDRGRKVERIADYGMKDGKVFDYISRTTPSGGEELSYLGYLFRIWKLS